MNGNAKSEFAFSDWHAFASLEFQYISKKEYSPKQSHSGQINFLTKVANE